MVKKTKIKMSKTTLAGDKLKITYNYPIRVGFLPDIHGGATRAITTEVFETKEGTIIVPNDIQRMLRKLWKRNIELFNRYKIQYVAVVGDAFAGSNPAEAGYYISMTKPDQVRLVTELLIEVWEGCKKVKPIFLIWRGTQYHESRRGESDMHEQLVNNLKAAGIEAVYLEDHAYVELYNGRTRRLFMAHEAPTGLVYPATLMSRDIQWACAGEATGATLPVDAIIRAHLHHWLHVDHSGKHAVQLPCWQAHTPYKQTVRYFFKLQPTLGGAMMLMDEYGRLDFWGGSYPFSFNKEEHRKLHEMTVSKIGLDPRLKNKYRNYSHNNPTFNDEWRKKYEDISKKRKY